MHERNITQQRDDKQTYIAESQSQSNPSASSKGGCGYVPPSQAAHANSYDTQQQWAPNSNGSFSSKTKKQLVGLTCALSLVCGILGGVIGGGLSTALNGSSQTGGMQQNSMQQPGGQDGGGSNQNAPGASGNGGAADSSGDFVKP